MNNTPVKIMDLYCDSTDSDCPKLIATNYAKSITKTFCEFLDSGSKARIGLSDGTLIEYDPESDEILTMIEKGSAIIDSYYDVDFFSNVFQFNSDKILWILVEV